MIVNNTKTKVMVFGVKRSGKPKKKPTYKFCFNGEEIKIVNTYNYLGFQISSNTKNLFRKMHLLLENKAKRAVYALHNNVSATLGYVPSKIALGNFDSHILPVLEYGSPVWFTGCEIGVLEKVQLAYLKSLLGVRKQTASVAVLAETGRFPLLIRQKVAAIHYFFRILRLPSDSLLHTALMTLIDLSNQGQYNWVCKLKNIFSECSLSINLLKYREYEKIDNDKTMQVAKTILYKMSEEDILETIHDGSFPKLRTYSLIKKDFRIEPHLLYVKNVKFCKAITRFRISSHNLEIELGRHKKPKIPAEERKCQKCNTEFVEDETHHLLVCSKFGKERKELISVFKNCYDDDMNTMQDGELFVKILSCKEKEMLYELGRYLVKCDQQIQ